MSFTKKLQAIRTRFKLDSHHTIERFGVFVALFAVLGAVAFGSAGISSVQNGRAVLSDTALYTSEFTTSKTELIGAVDGVYRSSDGTRALVVMHFDRDAAISYNAEDYQAFLLGATPSLASKPVSTKNVSGTFHVFGSTGYIGVLLDAEEPFDRQILNLTMRANAELAYSTEEIEAQAAAEAGLESSEATDEDSEYPDASFTMFDQWEVYLNPGAAEVQAIPALDDVVFDPARAFYDVILQNQEREARAALDAKLLQMRADLTQLETYSDDLETTQVDGVTLVAPELPEFIAGDEVTGGSAEENESGTADLDLVTDQVIPGGIDLDWRSGNVYDGYLDQLLAPGQTSSAYLAALETEALEAASSTSEIESQVWMLSDGTNLSLATSSSDVTLRPLTTLMTNLSTAQTNYATHKTEYQTVLMRDLLVVEIDMRDVRSNSSVNSTEEFLTIYL